MDVLKYRFGDFATLTVSTNGKIDRLIYDYRRRICKGEKDRLVEYSFSDDGEIAFCPLTEFTPIPARSNVYEGLPVIFEQPTYFFDVTFEEGKGIDCGSIAIRHRLDEIESQFYRRGVSLVGQLSFVNDPGRFRLEVEYKRSGVTRVLWAEFLVASTKMDVDSDYKTILGLIEREQKELIFSPYAKTVHDAGTLARVQEESEDKRWAVYFDAAFDEYEQALKRILHRPHQTLVDQIYDRRVDQVKRWTTSLVREYVRLKSDKSRLEASRFRAPEYEMAIDTPENRFVKYTLKGLTRSLESAEQVIRADERYSEAFKKRMAERVKNFYGYLRMPMMRLIGDMRGVVANSLVLQMRPGYAEIRSIWQVMHSFFTTDASVGKSLSVGFNSIAALYEYWCFMMVRKIVGEVLGVEGRLTNDQAPDLKRILDESVLPEDAKAQSVTYRYEKAGATIADVVFQQTYGPDGTGGFAAPYQQRPDIVLRFYDSTGTAYTYLFDAKYRIELGQQTGFRDAAPRDALDQMHRYRDAILWREKRDAQEKSLEVLGAYVLFPADETAEGRVYPYQDLLMSQNIGAFPLLPNKMEKLIEHIRYIVEERIQFKSADQNWLKSDVIPHKGLSYVVGEGFGEDDVVKVTTQYSSVDIRDFAARNHVPVLVSDLGARDPERVKMVAVPSNDGSATRFFKVVHDHPVRKHYGDVIMEDFRHTNLRLKSMSEYYYFAVVAE